MGELGFQPIARALRPDADEVVAQKDSLHRRRTILDGYFFDFASAAIGGRGDESGFAAGAPFGIGSADKDVNFTAAASEVLLGGRVEGEDRRSDGCRGERR